MSSGVPALSSVDWARRLIMRIVFTIGVTRYVLIKACSKGWGQAD